MKKKRCILKKEIEQKRPFAIISYKEMCSITNNFIGWRYEILRITKRNQLFGKILENTDDIAFIKNNNILKEVISNENGKVWEFMDFKKVKEKKGVSNKNHIL